MTGFSRPDDTIQSSYGANPVVQDKERTLTNLCIDSDFELMLPIAEVHDLVQGYLGGVPLVGLPHQLLQLLLLLLSRSQLTRQVTVLMRLSGVAAVDR